MAAFRSRRDNPEISIRQGRLRGRWTARGEVAVFRGVPFAEPPVGGLRWKPPRPAEPWSGVLDAAKDGPIAIQRRVDISRFLDALVEGYGWSSLRVSASKLLLAKAPRPVESEDCLYLTIRTPELAPERPLPVMVWIHGGDHQDGSGIDPQYASNALAKRHVVTVAINYRLGVFGYLAHPELSAESSEGVSGNYGTLDQIAALEWIRDNISAFGGDPENVTIFGESAGGESVMHLMTSPLAEGLFHRAIAQSPANGGQMQFLDEPFRGMPGGLEVGSSLARSLGAGAHDQLGYLRRLPADVLNTGTIDHGPRGGLYPLIDGHVIPVSPLAAFAHGEQAKVPLIVGSNANEATAMMEWVFTTPMIEYRHLEAPPRELQPSMIEAFGSDIDELVRLYPGLDWRDRSAEIEFCGDHLFGAPAFHYARHHQRAGCPTWLYHFSRTPPSPTQTVGAHHAAELPFVHGIHIPGLAMTADDRALSSEMTRYWTNMASSGTPNPARVDWPPFDANNPHWLRLDHQVVHEPVDKEEQYRILNARTARLVADMCALE